MSRASEILSQIHESDEEWKFYNPSPKNPKTAYLELKDVNNGVTHVIESPSYGSYNIYAIGYEDDNVKINSIGDYQKFKAEYNKKYGYAFPPSKDLLDKLDQYYRSSK